MRAVVQRVTQASVQITVDSRTSESGAIESGLVVLVGVSLDDTEQDAAMLADKIANLRVFEDEDGKMNRSLLERAGSALVVSNFTLFGDCRKGRRPSFSSAAPGPQARTLYEAFGAALQSAGVPVRYGVFGAEMRLTLTNDGPVTLLLDSRRLF